MSENEGELKKRIMLLRKEVYIRDSPSQCPFCKKVFMQPIPIDSIAVAEGVVETEKQFLEILDKAKVSLNNAKTYEELQREIVRWFGGK